MSKSKSLQQLNEELLIAEQEILSRKKDTYAARKSLLETETLLFESNERKLAILEKIQIAKNGVEVIDDNRASHIAHLKENLPRLMEKIAHEPALEKIEVGGLNTNN